MSLIQFNVARASRALQLRRYDAVEDAGLPSISVIGLGYVGAVSTACLASLGHCVVGADIDAGKVEAIAAGTSPIHENELGDLLEDGVDQNLISATTDIAAAVKGTDITFVSVGTPTAEDGGCDNRAIVGAARAIGEALRNKDSFHIVVMRCSIPPGTTNQIMVPQIEAASGKTAGKDFGVCFNPEFLREGTAVADFRKPPKTVIGCSDALTAEKIAALYSPVDDNPIVSTIEVAEMVKYADNVWHATKVCFANEIGRICKPLGVDSHNVMDIFVQDTKLNLSPYYLKPGFAFGGSCLPKEVRAVRHLAQQLGVKAPLVDSLIPSNEAQILATLEALRATGAKRIGFLGLAFKPGTDDLRESPILEVIDEVLSEGCTVAAYDTAIRADIQLDGQFAYVRNACPHLERTVYALPGMLCEDAQTVIDNVDAVVVTHRDESFRRLLEPKLGKVAVIDVARLFGGSVKAPGYYGIGW